MGWNTGLSLVTDLNKDSSLLMVLKLNVLQIVCVVRLDTNIFIGISVWDLEGAKNSNEKPRLTLFFWSYIIGYSRNSDFENGTKFWGGFFFSYGPKCKTLKLDKIRHFLLKNMQYTQSSEKIYQYFDLCVC